MKVLKLALPRQKPQTPFQNDQQRQSCYVKFGRHYSTHQTGATMRMAHRSVES